MDKLLFRLVFLAVAIMILGAAGFALDLSLPEQFDWIAWLSVAVVFMLFSFIREGRICRLRNHVYKDPLTGLDNRRCFYIKINRELSAVKLGKGCTSLLMIDIDDFKSINDSWGHIAGDKVLGHMASIFMHNIRSDDTIARWGGEEFAVILPNTDKNGALKIAERIRSAVEEHTFYWQGVPQTITVSIGIATAGESMEAEQFVNLADKALYRAKEKKNLVVAA